MENNSFADALVNELLAYQRKSQTEGFRNETVFQLPFPGKIGVVPDETAKKFPGLDAAFGATICTSLCAEYSVRIPLLATALDLCESPIEARFLLGLICSSGLHGLTVKVADDEQEEIYAGQGGSWDDMTLWVFPQVEIDEHRVDFALHLTFVNPQIQFARMVGQPDPRGPLNINERLVVECDGHDFHERTSEQAARDKSRDRVLLNFGYPVMRFTGSEIVAGPLKCAAQVMDWVFDKKSKAGREIW